MSKAAAVLPADKITQTTTKTPNGSNIVSKPNETRAPIRQLPSREVFVPIGSQTVDISVPFRPLIDTDPEKTGQKVQPSGGITRIHNALDHLADNTKDMPEACTPQPTINRSDTEPDTEPDIEPDTEPDKDKSTKGDEESSKDDQEDNDSVNTDTSCDARDKHRPYEAAIGFSSDDDETFFPSARPKEGKFTQGHSNKPSKSYGKEKGKEDFTSVEGGMDRPPLPSDFHGSHSRSSKRPELSRQKPELSSKPGSSTKMPETTMNANAPEFVRQATFTYPALGQSFMAIAPGASFPTFPTQFRPPGMRYSSRMNLTMPPFAAAPGQFHPYVYQERLTRDPRIGTALPPPGKKRVPLRVAAPPFRPSSHNHNHPNASNKQKGQAGEINMSRTGDDKFNRDVGQGTDRTFQQPAVKGEGSFNKHDGKFTVN
jgi:hypothetical protein